MPTYDHRTPKSAADDDTDEKDTLESLIGMVGDGLGMADDIVSDLAKRTDTDLYDAQKYAKETRDCLSTAEGVETIRDFVANIKDAWEQIRLLEPALKTAKRQAKADDDSVALDAVEEALDGLKYLKRELREIDQEIQEVPTKG